MTDGLGSGFFTEVPCHSKWSCTKPALARPAWSVASPWTEELLAFCTKELRDEGTAAPAAVAEPMLIEKELGWRCNQLARGATASMLGLSSRPLPPGAATCGPGTSISIAKQFGHAPARQFAEGTRCYQTRRVVVCRRSVDFRAGACPSCVATSLMHGHHVWILLASLMASLFAGHPLICHNRNSPQHTSPFQAELVQQTLYRS